MTQVSRFRKNRINKRYRRLLVSGSSAILCLFIVPNKFLPGQKQKRHLSDIPQKAPRNLIRLGNLFVAVLGEFSRLRDRTSVPAALVRNTARLEPGQSHDSTAFVDTTWPTLNGFRRKKDFSVKCGAVRINSRVLLLGEGIKSLEFRKELLWMYLGLVIAASIGVSNLLIFLPNSAAGELSIHDYVIAVVSSGLILLAIIGFFIEKPNFFIPFIVWDIVLIVLKLMGYQVAFLGAGGLILFCMGYSVFYKFIDKKKMAAVALELNQQADENCS